MCWCRHGVKKARVKLPAAACASSIWEGLRENDLGVVDWGTKPEMAADRTGGKQGLRQEQKPHRSHAGWEQRRHRARAGGCTPAEGACTAPPRPRAHHGRNRDGSGAWVTSATGPHTYETYRGGNLLKTGSGKWMPGGHFNRRLRRWRWRWMCFNCNFLRRKKVGHGEK